MLGGLQTLQPFFGFLSQANYVLALIDLAQHCKKKILVSFILMLALCSRQIHQGCIWYTASNICRLSNIVNLLIIFFFLVFLDLLELTEINSLLCNSFAYAHCFDLDNFWVKDIKKTLAGWSIKYVFFFK